MTCGSKFGIMPKKVISRAALGTGSASSAAGKSSAVARSHTSGKQSPRGMTVVAVCRATRTMAVLTSEGV